MRRRINCGAGTGFPVGNDAPRLPRLWDPRQRFPCRSDATPGSRAPVGSLSTLWSALPPVAPSSNPPETVRALSRSRRGTQSQRQFPHAGPRRHLASFAGSSAPSSGAVSETRRISVVNMGTLVATPAEWVGTAPHRRHRRFLGKIRQFRRGLGVGPVRPNNGAAAEDDQGTEGAIPQFLSIVSGSTLPAGTPVKFMIYIRHAREISIS